MVVKSDKDSTYMTVRVVFVCLGNICRSPMAEAVFQDMVNKAGLSDEIIVDSVGTGSWHVGEPPHRGTQQVLKEHGIQFDHRAQQLAANDLKTADYLIAMDRDNLSSIRRIGSTEAETGLLLDYANNVNEVDVPDPYYSGGFDHVYRLVEAGCRGLLEHIRQQEGIT